MNTGILTLLHRSHWSIHIYSHKAFFIVFAVYQRRIDCKFIGEQSPNRRLTKKKNHYWITEIFLDENLRTYERQENVTNKKTLSFIKFEHILKGLKH